MVNYCCVTGCGRNSRTHRHLKYYGLPKEKYRQNQWLKAAGKDNWLNRDLEKARRSVRFCSRHFPSSFIKNKYLSNDAVPSKRLPGSLSEDEEDDLATHEDVICDNCSKPILGFRYKCVNCDNYDLCAPCETFHIHSEHYMLRIPRSLKFEIADNLIRKWRAFFKSEHVTPTSHNVSQSCDGAEHFLSSDDEPVTKYARNHDKGLELSEDVKKSLRVEVERALNAVQEKEIVKAKTKSKKKECSSKVSEELPRKNVELNNSENGQEEQALELAFADVNQYEMCEVKSEANNSLALPNSADPPMYFVKMSDDLSELMIEISPNGGRNISLTYNQI